MMEWVSRGLIGRKSMAILAVVVALAFVLGTVAFAAGTVGVQTNPGPAGPSVEPVHRNYKYCEIVEFRGSGFEPGAPVQVDIIQHAAANQRVATINVVADSQGDIFGQKVVLESWVPAATPSQFRQFSLEAISGSTTVPSTIEFTVPEANGACQLDSDLVVITTQDVEITLGETATLDADFYLDVSPADPLEGATLTFDVPGVGSDTGITDTNGHAQVTLTPTEAGTFPFTVSFAGGSAPYPEIPDASAAANLRVLAPQAPNNPPAAEDDTAATTAGTPVDIDVLANDSDPDAGDTIGFDSIDGTSANGALISRNSDDTLRYSPPSSFVGSDTFDYTIKDSHGAASTATVTVTVSEAQPSNHDPVAVDDSETTNQGEAVTVWVVENDTDADGDDLYVDDITQPANGTTAIREDSLAVLYTPNATFTGTDTFTYTVTDGNGGTDVATVTVTVGAPENQPPTAVDQAVTTPEGTAKTIFLEASDPDFDTLSYHIVTGPSNGSLGDVVENSVEYTPNEGYTGSDSFTFKVNDGEADSNTATVTITITPVSRGPVAVDDAASTYRNQSVTINVLANDKDSSGGSNVEIITWQSPSDREGTVTKDADGRLVYTPPANWTGTDSFEYTIQDYVEVVPMFISEGPLTSTATVTVTVRAPYTPPPTPSNHAPDAVDDTATTNQGTAVTVNVLANDTDPDGDTLTVTTVGNAEHGTVALTEGQATYTPAEGYTGTDSFTYTISDGKGGTDTATVTVTVKTTEVGPPPPIINPEPPPVTPPDLPFTGGSYQWLILSGLGLSGAGAFSLWRRPRARQH